VPLSDGSCNRSYLPFNFDSLEISVDFQDVLPVLHLNTLTPRVLDAESGRLLRIICANDHCSYQVFDARLLPFPPE
jgi:hypothetical protein